MSILNSFRWPLWFHDELKIKAKDKQITKTELIMRSVCKTEKIKRKKHEMATRNKARGESK